MTISTELKNYLGDSSLDSYVQKDAAVLASHGVTYGQVADVIAGLIARAEEVWRQSIQSDLFGIDGALAAEFLRTLKSLLEKPSLLLV